MHQMKEPRRHGQTTSSNETIYEDLHPSSDWTAHDDPKSHVLLIDLPGFKKEELNVQVNNLGKLTVSGDRQVSENKHQRFKQVFDMPEDSDFQNVSARFDGEEGLLYVIIHKKQIEEIEETKNENQTALNKIEEKKKDDKHLNNKETPDIHSKKEEESQGMKEDGRHMIDNTKKEENKRNSGEEISNGSERQNREGNWRKVTKKVKNREGMEVSMRYAMDKMRKNNKVIITAILAFSIGLYISHKFYS